MYEEDLQSFADPVYFDPEEDPDFMPGAIQIVEEDGQMIEETTEYVPGDKKIVLDDLDLEEEIVKEQSVLMAVPQSNLFDWDLSLSDLTVSEGLMLIALTFGCLGFVLFKRWGD